jgi:ubiquinone/menaquinone biosynthesis C-methylase UbiE
MSQIVTKPDDIYNDPVYVNALDHWGEDTVWKEIQYIMAPLQGSVLDIACGTGKVIEILSYLKRLDIHGFDLSMSCIQKAKDRGIKSENLLVSDATKLSYPNKLFDYSYSVGSLEHIPDTDAVISEIFRVTKYGSYHHFPVSMSGKDEGWMYEYYQWFYNNSVQWWKNKFEKYYDVDVLPSRYTDNVKFLSDGIWLICNPKYV